MSRTAHGGRPTRMAQCGIAEVGSPMSVREGREIRDVVDILETDEGRHLLEAAHAAGGSL